MAHGSDFGEEINVLDSSKEERNNWMQMEQQNRAASAETGSEKQSLEISHNQDNVADEQKINGCKENNSFVDKCALNTAPQLNCQHISTDSKHTDYDVVKEDDGEETKQNVNDVHENGQSSHSQEEFAISSNSDSYFESEKGRKSEAKHAVITITRTECLAQETKLQETGETDVSVCVKTEEEGNKDCGTWPHHLSSPSDVSRNILITSTSTSTNPPPGSVLTRATFSPGSPTDKQLQLPALFRVLRNETMAQTNPPPQGAKRAVVTEKQDNVKAQVGFLDQISQFLSRERVDERLEVESEASRDQVENKLNENDESQEEERKELQIQEDVKVLQRVDSAKSVSSAEAAFDAFKAFFTPKPLKKDPAEKVDLEAVRKKIKSDKDVLRMLFERNSKKSPEKKDSSDCTVSM